MRIIGGKFRGTKLERVSLDTTRETSDMVKESVFNMLPNLTDYVVLDLFAGSGSYGLESYSRGAKKVVFNDLEKKACQTILKNITKLKLDNYEVNNISYKKYLESYLNHKFDLVFLDPPYDLNIYEEVIIKLIPYLNHEAIIVCEMRKDVNLPEIEGFSIIKEKKYGIKKIIFYQSL